MMITGQGAASQQFVEEMLVIDTGVISQPELPRYGVFGSSSCLKAEGRTGASGTRFNVST